MIVFYRLLPIALALLLPVAAWAQDGPTIDVRSNGDRAIATLTYTFDLNPEGSLELDSRGGDIRILANEDDGVRVEEIVYTDDLSEDDARQFALENQSSYKLRGNRLSIEGPRGSGREFGGWPSRGDRQRDYTVYVPTPFDVDVKTTGGTIDFEGLRGTLRARTMGGEVAARDVGGDVRLSSMGGAMRAEDVDGNLEVQTYGGEIKAERVTGRMTLKTAGGSVRVREAERDVRIQTAGGNILAETIGGGVQAQTAGGSIRLTDIRADAEAQTAGGDVIVASVGGSLNASTAGGDIEGQTINGPVTAETMAGDIELDDVRGGVEAHTTIGDIEIEMTRNGEVSYETDLSTSHGDIRIALPPDLSMTIDAVVESAFGGIDRDDIYSAFPVTREGGETGPLRVSGDVNGGGTTIRLRTTGGSIRIEKSE